MEHERHGHVRFPVAVQAVRQNPPTTGGTAMPDERVDDMLKYIEGLRFEYQKDALGAGLGPIALREQNIGAYHAVLMVRARFLKLFRTALPVPAVDEPEGASNE